MMQSATQYDTGRPGGQMKRPFLRRKWVWMLFTSVVVGIMIIVIVVATGGSSSSSSRSAPSVGLVLPESSLPEEELKDNTNELGSVLVSIYDRLGMAWNTFADQGSAQALALTWVAGSGEYADMDRSQRIQRYALGVFYYSTFQQPHNFITDQVRGWKSASRWMSSENECTWEGILCNSNSKVSGIILPEHSLTGTLPPELALFRDHLQTLDLAKNFILVQGDGLQVFGYLYKLETLIFDDNYMVTTTGLPESFGELVAIKKLSLSYNLLQGQLNGSTLWNMQALQHLEVESNYLSGSLPVQLGQLPNLVYLYARRNSFKTSLTEIMAPGNLSKIFAFWLDSNEIIGRIPTSVGLLTDLASLSITNSTLTGPIPTEIGQLIGLQRLWLYDNLLTGQVPAELASLPILEVLDLYQNKLVGTIPDAVCQTVKSSPYEFSSLSVDCDEVECRGCCTCY